MNSAKSVEYASGILNRVFINPNITNLVTSCLMSGQEGKIMVKVDESRYRNINLIRDIRIFKTSKDLPCMLVVINDSDFLEYGEKNRCFAEKIVAAIGNSDLIEDFNKVFGNDAQK